MKVLIMTGRFGMGHVKCAETLRDIMVDSDENVEVQVVDLMDYMYPAASDVIYSGFNALVKNCSNLYNRMNEMAGKYSVQPLKGHTIHCISRLMREVQPDLVVANLPICGQYFSLYRRVMGDRTPLYVCVTDVTFHREWVAPGADMYFVGDGSTRDALIENGVAPEIIHVTGIPVSKGFTSFKSDTAAKRILIMGGGLGLVPGGTRTLDILNRLEGVKVTLVCGKNEQLYDYAVKNYENLEVLGFTRNIPLLMADSQVIVTKPGGITTYEAIKSETPLYIIAPSLEQEIGNAKFIERYGLGRILETEEEFTAEDILGFVTDEKLIGEIRENMRELSGNFEPANVLEYYKEAAGAAIVQEVA